MRDQIAIHTALARERDPSGRPASPVASTRHARWTFQPHEAVNGPNIRIFSEDGKCVTMAALQQLAAEENETEAN